MRLQSSGGYRKVLMSRSLLVVFISVFLLIWVGFSAAAHVPIEKARRVAQNWLYSSQFNKTLASKSSPSIMGEEVMQYRNRIVGYNFLLYPYGHVIVPSKDELPVVKLYSYTTRLSTADASDIVQWIEEELFLLDEAIDVHAAELASVSSTETPNGQLWRKFDKDPVIFSFEYAIDMGTGLLSVSAGPLIHTTWDQADPYNLYTPLWSDGQKTVTGCVATAAAQIMKYWSYPVTGQGSTSYTWNNGAVDQTLSQDFSTSTYNWNLMTNSYGSGSAPAEKDAVAQLMSDVGVAFHMTYGKAASGANTLYGTTVFPTYFNYKNSLQSVARSNYANDSAWMQVFQNEVENSRPSQLRIKNTTDDTHSIVVDGYRDTPVEQIHINLGWSGSYDGWYVSNNIVTGPHNWTDVNYQAAVIGIEPNNAVTMCETAPMTIEELCALEPSPIMTDIVPDDCVSVKYGTGWYADFYTFTGSAGDKISISLSEQFYGEGRMVLYGPNGLELGVWDYRIPSGSGYYTLPQTGTYTLEMTTQYAGSTGNYTLKSAKPSDLNELRTAPMTIEELCALEPSPIMTDIVPDPDDCVSLKYGRNWYADFYTFTGSAGDKISISLSEQFYGEGRMVLYGPNGLELGVWDYRIPSGSGYYTLPQTGTYTLEMTTQYAGSTGHYTLSSLSSDTTAPTPGIVTPYNISSGSFVDRPFDLKTTFTDNESTVTSCEYTTNGADWNPGVVSGPKPNFTCTKTGINKGSNGQTLTDGQPLTLNMRARSGGGISTATPVTRTVDAQPPTDGTLTLIPSNSQVKLNWSTAFDSRSGLRATNTYKVMRKTGTSPDSKCTNTNGSTQVHLGNSNSVVDSGLTNGTVYYYRVCAYDKVNNISTGATANAIPNWASKKLTNNAGNSINTSIAVDGESIYVAWQDDTPGNSEIYFRMSTDGGVTWAAARRLTNNTGNSANPAIAVNGTNIYVVWQNDTTSNPDVYDIYVRMSADGGDTWTTAKNLSNNAGNSTNPSIAVAGLNVYIAWNDDIPGNPEIYFRESNDGGYTWAVAQPITSNAGISLSPSIAVNGSNIYVAWEDDTPGNYEIFTKKSTNGGTTWSTNKRLTSNLSDSANPAIAVNGTNIYVVWQNDTTSNPDVYDIYFRMSTDGGNTWTIQRKLISNAGNSANPAVAVDGLNVYVVWNDDTPGNPEIYFRESNDGGATWAPTENRSNNAGNSLNPSIAVDGSNPYIMWSDDTPGNPEIFITY